MGSRRQSYKGVHSFCDMVAAGSVPSIPSVAHWANSGVTGGCGSHGLVWSNISRRCAFKVHTDDHSGIERYTLMTIVANRRPRMERSTALKASSGDITPHKTMRAKALSWRTQGGTDLLCRVCLLAAVSSAVFTKDSTCVVLTGFVLKLCREKSLHPKPFLLALACSSNIGSAATPIGNPQNLVIAVQGKLGFGQFVFGVLPAVVVGLALNTIGLLVVFGRSLSIEKVETVDEGGEDTGLLQRPPASPRGNPETRRNCSFSIECGDGGPGGGEEGDIGGFGLKLSWLSRKFLKEHERRIWKALFFVCIVAFWLLGATMQIFEAGLGLPWTAITAAVVLTVVDFSDATATLDKVSYSILVFFSGMFITVEGFNRTGAPAQFWLAVEPYSRIDTARGEAILSVVVTFLSNVASNVPTVLLLGPRVAAAAVATSGASPDKAWLILAWVSTVAGNLTLVGSAANIIVCEKARSEPFRYSLSFWEHLKYGFLSTLIIIIIGLPFIKKF